MLVAGAVGVRRLGYDEFAFIRRGTVLRVYESPVVNTSMFVVFADLAMSGLAAYLALGLKLDSWNPRETGQALVDLIAVFAPLTALVFWYTGMYRGSWRVAGVADLARAGGAAAAVTVAGAVVASAALVRAAADVGLPDLWPGHRWCWSPPHAPRTSSCEPVSGGRATTAFPCWCTAPASTASRPPRNCSRTLPAGLKPVGFVDDDPARTGKLVNGLPVLGRSYELEALIAAHGVKAVVIASPVVPAECHVRIVHASGRLGIKLFRMHVQLEQLLEETVDLAARESAPAAAATARAAALAGVVRRALPPSRIGAVRQCGGRNVRRSRAKGVYERFRKLHTPARPFRCDDCGWRGWLLPLEHAMAIRRDCRGRPAAARRGVLIAYPARRQRSREPRDDERPAACSRPTGEGGVSTRVIRRRCSAGMGRTRVRRGLRLGVLAVGGRVRLRVERTP